jgi:hypothetical protein
MPVESDESGDSASQEPSLVEQQLNNSESPKRGSLFTIVMIGNKLVMISSYLKQQWLLQSAPLGWTSIRSMEGAI